MESHSGPDTGSHRRRVSVVQLICRAYGLTDASEITLEHIHRYVAEHRDEEQRDEGQRTSAHPSDRTPDRTSPLRERFRPHIPRPRASDDAA